MFHFRLDRRTGIAYTSDIAITARIAGLDDRIGSLRVGKDADLLVTDGDPLDYRTKVTAVYIDGKQVK